MAPLIRSAILANDRRQLIRPKANEITATSNMIAKATCNDAATEQVQLEVERQLSEGRRQLELERENVRKAMEAEQAEALERAVQTGYTKGMKLGEAEGRAILAKEALRLQDTIDELRQVRGDVLAEAEDALVELVFAAICRLVGTEGASRDVAANAVRSACAALHGEDTLTILVHPDDLTALRERLGTMESVSLLPSPVVRVGGCMIAGAAGTLDARLETQVEGLRIALAGQRARRREGETGC